VSTLIRPRSSHALKGLLINETLYATTKQKIKNALHTASRTGNRILGAFRYRASGFFGEAYSIQKIQVKISLHVVSELVFINFYGAQESIPCNRFRQPM
jgi:hypothetical protein